MGKAANKAFKKKTGASEIAKAKNLSLDLRVSREPISSLDKTKSTKVGSFVAPTEWPDLPTVGDYKY